MELFTEARDQAIRASMAADVERQHVVRRGEELTRRALTDALTGIPNRATFDLRLRDALSGLPRGHGDFALLLFDVDLIARFGGDEFAVLAPQTDAHGVSILAERVCRCVEDLAIETGGKRLPVTVSVGVVLTSDYPCPPDAQTLFDGADEQLYLSKKAGRNTWSYRGQSGPTPVRC